jgi:hypothetical protein
MNTAIASVVIDTALMLALAYAGLWVRTFENRTTQTITALAGTGILFGIFAAPIMYLISYNTSDEVSIASFVFLILVMWQISVIGHIMRHALSIPFWAGFGISLFYIYTSFRVMSFLVVVSTGQAQ